jgi:hypothetical protein
MEAAMKRGRMMTKATPLLIGIGLFLSACAVEPDYSDYGAPDYAYTDPVYGSLDFDYGGWGGGWGGFRHFDHDHGHDGFGHGFGHAGFGGGHGGGHGGGFGGGHGGGFGGGGHGGGGGGHR